MPELTPINGPKPALLAVRVVEGPDDVAVLEAEGELDLSSAPELRGPLFERVEGGVRIVLDLSKVSFIDSSGIAVLVQAHRASNGDRSNGGPALHTVIAPGSQVARVFELATLDRALPVFENRDHAIRGLTREGSGS
ncbi:MAG: STAS domain-containing protein [Solirubrobacterales bacterium]